MENELEVKSVELLSSLEINHLYENKENTQFVDRIEYKGQGMSEILTIKGEDVVIAKHFTTNPKTNKKSVKILFSNNFIILSESNYETLEELIKLTLNVVFFTNNATYNFLENTIYEWIVNCMSEKRIAINLVNFLYISVDKSLKEYIYYFPIDSMAIEKPFDLGIIEITFFTEQEILNQYEKLKLVREDCAGDIDELFKKYRNRIIAKTKVKGIPDKAEIMAKKNVVLALNVFKLFFSYESVNDYYQMFDVEFESKRLSPYTFLCESSRGDFDFKEMLQVRHGSSPIVVNDRVLGQIAKENIYYLLQFISSYKDNELNNVIVGFINDLGSAFSIRNYYERVVKLVSSFEGILLSTNHKKGAGETLLKNNVLKKMNLSEEEDNLIKKLIRDYYEVRNKYIHNKLELPINLIELGTFQYFSLKFIFLLVEQSAHYSNLDEVLIYFEVKI